MKIDEAPTNFVDRADYETAPETLEKAAKECDAYSWYRAADDIVLCQHKDAVHVVVVGEDLVGCSCGAMTFKCKGNQACKHLATLLKREKLPTEPVAKALVPELLKAGWKGTSNNMRPTDATVHDDPAPPFGTKTYERECPYCQEVHSDVSPEAADTWLKGHMQDCKKNPKKKEMNEMKTKTKRTPVEVGGVPPLNAEEPAPNHPVEEEVVEPEEPEHTPEAETKPPTPPDTSLDADVRAVIDEAEGLGAKDIDPAYVRDKLAAMKKFKVAPEEAHNGVVNGVLRIQGIKRPKAGGGPNQLVTIATIDAPDRWINLRVKVTQLWDSDHESIRQIGLVGDETGVIKFVSWEKADLGHVEPDKCYSIDNVVTNEYEGTYSVAFTKNTNIAEITDDIEVGFVEKTISGVLITIQGGSGFITRCPTCNRAMRGGECEEHGKSKGIPDLRLKLVIDNGITHANVLLNREMTEKLTGIDLDAAREMAAEAFDANVVADKMTDMLVGRELDIVGQAVGSTTLATDVKFVDAAPTKQEIEALMKEAN